MNREKSQAEDLLEDPDAPEVAEFVWDPASMGMLGAAEKKEE